MEKRALIMLVGAMLATYVMGGDAFKYRIGFDDISMEETAWTFGRVSGAEDGTEDLDNPIPPRNPGEIGLNYISFRGQLGTNYDMLKLGEDYRSTDNSATSWTMDVEVATARNLRWEAEKALSSSESTLELVLPNGTSVDMKSVSSISSLVSGTYLIRYKATAATVEAPEVPELIDKEMAVYDGGSISIKLFDPGIYELAEDTPYEISFFKGNDDARVKVAGPTSEGLSFDATTGSIIYTFNTVLDFDEAVIIYRFRYKSDTRADNTSVTVGSVRTVVVEKPLLEMESAPEQTVDIKSTEAGANSCTMQYELAFPGKGYQGADITPDSPLTITGTMALPAWTCKPGKYETCPWTVTATDKGGTAIDVDLVNNPAAPADGTAVTTTATFTYKATSNGVGFNFVLTAAAGAKKGDATFSVACNFAGNDIVLPEDASSTTASINVKGATNLNIDGSETFDLVDVRLLRNYYYGGSAATSRGYTTMLSGTSYKNLTGTDKSEKATKFREVIADMIDSLDIDGSGTFDLTDVRLLRNYYYGGSVATARGDTTMLSGTSYKNLTGTDKSEKAALFRETVASMIEK